MDAIISVAAPDSLPQLIASVAALFAEDGGRRDRHMDTEWPTREGTNYYTTLFEDPRSLCLLAYATTESRGAVVGHLIGRILRPNPLRSDALVAVLESMRVSRDCRRRGIGTLLIGHFRDWALSEGANEASVTAYSANVSAISFYCHNGFVPFELTLHKPL
jgi:GNAT superfamily N-acetyltransferase